MALAPKPIVVAQVGPEVGGGAASVAGVERKVVGVFVKKRVWAYFTKAKKSFIEPAAAAGGAAGAIFVNIVAEGICDEEVDHFLSQEFRWNF